VQARYGKSDFEKRHYALLALMSIYGIELLADNVAECRAKLLESFDEYLGVDGKDRWHEAASNVLEVNVLEADALTMATSDGTPITFPEWGYLGKGKYQRRDFRFDNLTQRSSIEGSLFEMLDERELFKPTKVYPPMTVEEIAC
jgi:hypothetical protein